MTQLLNRYACVYCQNLAPTYKPQCGTCGMWDTFKPCDPTRGPVDPQSMVVRSDAPIKGFAVRRIKSGVTAVDSLMQGGFVKGRSVILAGSPGAGKSTLSLQLAGGFAKAGHKALYVCGEETVGAVQHRATRLGVAHADLMLTGAIEVDALRAVIAENNARVVVFDSVQMLRDKALRGEPGEVLQIKRCVRELGPWCSARNLVSVFLGHVTKDNKIGGPHFFRHMTDVTLELLVDEKSGIRSLRAKKNRDGGTDRVVRFRMSDKGLQEA